MTIQAIANYIVLAGAVFLAIKNILSILGEGELWVTSRIDRRTLEVLDKKMPQYLQEHSDKVSAKRREENQEDLQLISWKLDELNDKIDVVQDSNADLLRREMLKIYNKYRVYKKIPQYDKSDFYKMYSSYVQERGNSYAEDLLEHIKTWETVESEEEALGEN